MKRNLRQKKFILVYIFLPWIFLLINSISSIAQNPIGVNITITQPVTPFLPELASNFQGGRIQNSLSSKITIRLTNSGTTQQRVKLGIRVDRLSPSPAVFYTKSSYQPSQPIIVGAGQTIVLTPEMLNMAFGNFSASKLEFENINLNQMRENSLNIKLPEGTYRICANAFDYDRPGQSTPLSVASVGCAVFNICYSAAAPKFNTPISNFTGTPTKPDTLKLTTPQIQFSWTAPATTCGIPTGIVNYDLEVKQILSGQSINDAKNNAPIFGKININSNIFFFDTMMNRNVFKEGKKYVVRVKANIWDSVNSPIELANGGWSEPIAFVFKVPKTETQIFDEIQSQMPDSLLRCAGVPEITDTVAKDIYLNNDTVYVGSFVMFVNQATRNGKKQTGTGYINWSPFGGSPIKLKVAFKNIQVNKSKQLIKGVVNTVMDDTASGALAAFSSLQDLGDKLSNTPDQAIADLASLANSQNHHLRQISGQTPVGMPLGLDSVRIGGDNVTLAITGITFGKGGTNMRVLYSHKMPDNEEASQWLSLAGTGFCIKPDGFSFEKGILFLPNSRSITIDGTSFTLRGGMYSSSTDSVCYARFSLEHGLEQVFIKGSITLPEDLKEVNAKGKRTGNRVTLDMSFNFKNWDDWIANLGLSGRFELDDMSGFVFSTSSGVYYDHSSTKNPLTRMPWPQDLDSVKFKNKNNTFKGIYIQDMNLQLPNELVGKDSADENHFGVGFKNLFLNDENGLWADIYVDNVGYTNHPDGWYLSLDTIKIPIKKWIPSGAGISGKIGLPISEDKMKYNCLLTFSEHNFGFQFKVNPSGNYNVPMWSSKFIFSKESNLSIQKKINKSDVVLAATLTGKLNIETGGSDSSSPKVEFTALSIQGMKVSNYDTAGQNKFYFNPGQIRFGRAGNDSANIGTGYYRSNENGIDYTPEILYAHSGPNAEAYPPAPPSGSGSGSGTGDKVSGFNIVFDNFQPLVEPIEGNKLKIGMKFSFGISLGVDAIRISGRTRLGFYGIMEDVFHPEIPNRYGVDIDSITLEGDFGPVSVSGSLAFRRNDVKWGDGIAGVAKVSFPPGVVIRAEVVFGSTKYHSTSKYDYFGFGASVYVQAGLATIGPVVINGFGGGFYNNMSLVTNGGTSDNPTGRVEFEPSQGSMTFQASIALSYVQATVLKAGLTLTASINTNGGFSMSALNLYGIADIISNGGARDSGIVKAELDMTYDFIHDAFDAYIKVNASFYIGRASIPIWLHAGYNRDVPENESLEQKKARQAVKEDFEFWLYVGRPDEGMDRHGHAFEKVSLQLININKDIVKVNIGGDAYFCVGTALPNFPSLPSDIETFLNQDGVNGRSSSNASVISMISNSGGFMFGASVHGDIKVNIGVFYLDIQSKIGFDVALMHYTSAPPGCADANGNFGYNNWYALGQMYAFFAADVGIDIDIWFWKGKASLANLQMGAVLQAGLPNPEWMSGRIRIAGDVLDGMIHINTGCDFNIGQKCAPIGNPLENIEMITEVGPEGNNIDVLTNPYVVFSMPMSNQRLITVPFQVLGEEGEPITRTYKFEMVDASITPTEGLQKNRSLTQISKRFSSDGYTMTFVNPDAYAPKINHKIWVKCAAWELIEGSWEVPIEYKDKSKYSDGFSQDTSLVFRTGKALDSIEEKYVVYSYPILGQRHLLKNEFGRQGKIKLYKWDNNIFYSSVIGTPIYRLTFVPQGDSSGVIQSTFTPNAGQRIVTFNIPSSLQNNKVYETYLSVESNQSGLSKNINTKAINLLGNKSSSSSGGSSGNGLANTRMVDYLNLGNKSATPTDKNSFGQPVNNKSGMLPGLPGSYNSPININKQSGLIKEKIIADINDTISIKSKKSTTYNPVKGKVIYKTVFQTSRFNSFSEKIHSFSPSLSMDTITTKTSTYYEIENQNSIKKKSISYIEYSVFSDPDGPEAFDRFEIQGYQKMVNNSYLYIIPPLLYATIPYKGSNTADKQLKQSLYQPASFFGNQITFSNKENRRNVDGALWTVHPFSFNMSYIDGPVSFFSNSGSKQNPINEAMQDYMTIGGRGLGNQPIDLSMGISKRNLGMTFKRDDIYANDFVLLKNATLYYNVRKPLYQDFITQAATHFITEAENLYSTNEFRLTQSLIDTFTRNARAKSISDITYYILPLLVYNNQGAEFRIKNVNFWNATEYGKNVSFYMNKFRQMNFSPFVELEKEIQFSYGYRNEDMLYLNKETSNEIEFDYHDYPLYMSPSIETKTMFRAERKIFSPPGAKASMHNNAIKVKKFTPVNIDFRMNVY